MLAKIKYLPTAEPRLILFAILQGEDTGYRRKTGSARENRPLGLRRVPSGQVITRPLLT